jgi:hypothetical protein
LRQPHGIVHVFVSGQAAVVDWRDRSSNGNGAHAEMAMPIDTLSPEISFPYGFPKPGLYRIFVQVKRSGQVQTGIFDAHVQ